MYYTTKHDFNNEAYLPYLTLHMKENCSYDVNSIKNR